MNKSIKSILAGLLVVPVLALGMALSAPMTSSVHAATCADGSTAADGADCLKPPAGPTQCLFGANCAFTNITNTALFLIGAISVIMLIYGGIRYTISGGEASNVAAAKNTILYAIVGLVVALLAYAIVNFVVGALVQ